MRKFLAVGHHGPVDPAEGRLIGEASLGWITDRLADGSLDCLYSMDGGGRLVIANASSEDEVRQLLAAGPDVPRRWTVTELFDGRRVIEDYLASSAEQPG